MAKSCCGLNFAKNILKVFNLLFFFANFIIIGVAIWTLLDKFQYVHLLSSTIYPVIVYFMLSTAAIGIALSIIGCVAVFREHRIILILYIVLLGFILLSQAMVGIISFFYDENVRTDLDMNLNNTILTKYNVENDVTDAVDSLQENFRCCGVESYTHWRYSVWLQNNTETTNLVPDSCCKTVSFKCGTSDHPSNINYPGCIDRMARHMSFHLKILFVTSFGSCLLPLFGIILGCCLYFRLKKVVVDINENDSLLRRRTIN